MGVLYTKLSVEEALERLKDSALAPASWLEKWGLQETPEKNKPYVRVQDSKFELGLQGNAWAPPRISGRVEPDGESLGSRVRFRCYGPLAYALSGTAGTVIARLLYYFLAPLDPMVHPKTLLWTALTFTSVALVMFGVGYGLGQALWGKKTRSLLQFVRDTLEASEQPPVGGKRA